MDQHARPQVTEEIPPRKAFDRRIETNRILERLQHAKRDDLVSYVELSRLAGIDVQKDRGPLASAVRIICREDGKVFETIRNEGVMWLTDEGTSKRQSKHLKHVQNVARKSKREIETIDPHNLSREERDRLRVKSAIMNAIGNTARTKVRRELQDFVEHYNEKPSLKMIVSFRDHSKEIES